jgi:hypothetical protein
VVGLEVNGWMLEKLVARNVGQLAVVYRHAALAVRNRST